MRNSPDEVLAWCKEQMAGSEDWSGRPQGFCRAAYDVPAWADNAISAWGLVPRALRGAGATPLAAPRGAILYYAVGNNGFAAIASGVDTSHGCVTVDYVERGKVGYALRTLPNWDVRYLGFSFWTPFGELPH